MTWRELRQLPPHPRVAEYVEWARRLAVRREWKRRHLGVPGMLFVEGIWGPAFDYEFGELDYGFPLPKFPEFLHCVYFSVFRKGQRPLVIQIPDLPTRDGAFDPDAMETFQHYNSLLCSKGYMVLTFTRELMEQDTQRIRDMARRALQLCERTPYVDYDVILLPTAWKHQAQQVR